MSAQLRIENACIEGTTLGTEDHGILTAYIFVKGDGWGCGFGGYAFDEWDPAAKERRGRAYGMEFLRLVFSTLEVYSWEKLPGTPLRVETEGWGGRITRIGHYLKDKWFDPRQLAEQMREAEEATQEAKS